MLRDDPLQSRLPLSEASQVMTEHGTSANQVEKLRGLLDRLRSGDLQLNDAKSVCGEVMGLLAADCLGCPGK